MLSPQELTTLFQIISDENQTFENISETFKKSFDNSTQFKVATTLCFPLKDNLLNIQQRIISYYILYLLQIEANDTNLFMPIILEMAQNSKNKVEQNFLFDFLYNQIDYTKTQVKNYIQENSNKSKLDVSQIQLFLEKYYKETLNTNNSTKNLNDHMHNVIYDRKKSDIKNLDNRPPIDLTNNLKNEINLNYFQPNYMTYYPTNENNRLFNDEAIWISPTMKHDYIWEKEICNK